MIVWKKKKKLFVFKNPTEVFSIWLKNWLKLKMDMNIQLYQEIFSCYEDFVIFKQKQIDLFKRELLWCTVSFFCWIWL